MSERWTVHHGDCREVMQTLDPETIDSIVTDPPYGLSFMGKGWDHGVPGVEFWSEALRVVKPGAHLLAFGGTRTYHRLAVAIEDAGWDIRDCVMWVYGSGFPKSHDVSKAIDREAGAEREVVGTIKKTPSAGGDDTNAGWVRPWAEGKTTMDITATKVVSTDRLRSPMFVSAHHIPFRPRFPVNRLAHVVAFREPRPIDPHHTITDIPPGILDGHCQSVISASPAERE